MQYKWNLAAGRHREVWVNFAYCIAQMRWHSVAMGEWERESLATHLRSLSLDNFTIAADHVRVGTSRWTARRCACGDSKCDGWELEPLSVLRG
jgi:hypothetical protein